MSSVRRETLLCGIVLLMACFLVHARAVEGFFQADDYTIIGSFWGKGLRYLLRLVAADEIGGVWNERFVRPVRPWTLAFEGWVWGLAPAAFHLTNVLLHACASALIAGLVLQLGGGLLASVLAALFFLLHPLNVEVAAWISGRDESLSGASLLAAFLCHLGSEASPRRRAWLSVSLAFFAVSLFSKEYGVLFPVALGALSVVRGRPLREAFARAVPYLGVTVMFLGVRWLGVGHVLGGYGSSSEAHAAFQLGLLLDSVSSFLHELSSPAFASPVAGATFLLGVLLLAATGRSAGWRELASVGYWGVFWPLLFLMPTHNLVYTPRHLYVPFTGLAIGFGLALGRDRVWWRDGLAFGVGASLAAMLVPPTLLSNEEFARMGSRCQTVLSSIEPLADAIPDRDVLVLVNMPAHEIPPWGFGWSLEEALHPPFVREALEPRLVVVARRQWRPEAWGAYRQKHPGRGIHVLSWNRETNRVDILREER